MTRDESKELDPRGVVAMRLDASRVLHERNELLMAAKGLLRALDDWAHPRFCEVNRDRLREIVAACEEKQP